MDAAFEVHMLNDAGKEKACKIADDFNALLVNLQDTCGIEGSREMSIVKTKLEEACFFAKKAMANRIGNQD